MTIREIRGLTGLSQARFAALYKMSKRTVEEWEAGRRTPPEYVTALLERVVKEDFMEKKRWYIIDTISARGDEYEELTQATTREEAKKALWNEWERLSIYDKKRLGTFNFFIGLYEPDPEDPRFPNQELGADDIITIQELIEEKQREEE